MSSVGRGIARSHSKPAARHLHAVSMQPGDCTPDRVRAFFAEQLPWLIANRKDLFDHVRGTLALFVEGAGCWTLRFGDHASPEALTEGATFEGDCVTVFSVAGFTALLDGCTDGQAPVMIGDARLLSRLGQLMIEPARGALGARLCR